MSNRPRRPPRSVKAWIISGIAIVVLLGGAAIVFSRQDRSPPAVPAANGAGTPEPLELRKAAATSKVVDAIEKKDWAGYKDLLAKPDGFEDALSQTIRFADTHPLSDELFERLVTAVVEQWIAGKESARSRVLIARLFSKMNLATSLQKQVDAAAAAKMDKAPAERFRQEAFLGTIPYPKTAGDALLKTTLGKDPSAAREALYLIGNIRDEKRRADLRVKLYSLFFKASSPLRPYLAKTFLTDDAPGFRKDPHAPAILKYVKAQKEGAWSEVQALVR